MLPISLRDYQAPPDQKAGMDSAVLLIQAFIILALLQKFVL